VQLVIKRDMKPLVDTLDAHTDGDVVVVLNLTPDDGLLTQRTARELVNRFQKLRKKCGLQPADSVELFYDAVVATGAHDMQELAAAAAAEALFLKESLGLMPLEGCRRPRGAVVLGSEATSVNLPSGCAVEFSAVLATPAPAIAMDAVREDFGEGAVVRVEAFVASKGLSTLRGEAEEGGGAVQVLLDGRSMRLVAGRHLFWAAGDVPV
jgi:hypothetical protein